MSTISGTVRAKLTASTGVLSSRSSLGSEGAFAPWAKAGERAGISCDRVCAAPRRRLRMVSQPAPPQPIARMMNTTAGKPGTTAKIIRITAVMSSAFGSFINWPVMSVPRSALSSEATRVTMKPAVIDTNRAGICETRPSPMVSSE